MVMKAISAVGDKEKDSFPFPPWPWTTSRDHLISHVVIADFNYFGFYLLANMIWHMKFSKLFIRN